MAFRSLIAMFLCLVGIVPVVLGQSASRQPLEFEVDQSKWSLRTGAPVSLKLKVICSSSAILEGQLEIRIVDNVGFPIGSILLVDQVYSPGRQEVEYLLPIQSHPTDQPLQVETRFQGKNGEFYQSEGLLIPPTRCSFVCPIVRGPNAPATGDDYNWLSLEARCPKAFNDSTLAPMLTQLPIIESADLPRDPLKHLPHNVLVIEPSGFLAMQTQQVVALEAWVRGGGSLCLHIDENDLPAEQQAFVDRLIAPQPDLLADEVEGTELIPIIRDGKYAAIEYGFGHVLLTTKRSWSTANDTDQREVCCFLWRLNPVQATSVRQTGILSSAQIQTESIFRWNNYGYMSQQQLQQQIQVQQQMQQQLQDSQQQVGNGVTYIPSLDDESLRYWGQTLLRSRSNSPKNIISSLMPRDVQTVPIWLISTILLAYILAIGFGDYIILGRLKRRRWTWFTFPIVTVAVSLLSIGTAKGYLSSDVEISAIEYRDVTDDGMIARIHRFELHYRSSPSEQITSLDQVAYTPVARQSASVQNNPGGMPEEPTDTQLIAFRGVPTQQAQVVQQLEQWRPQLNRMVSFPRNRAAPMTLVPPKPGVPVNSNEYKAELSAQIKAAFPDVVYQELFQETDFLGLSGTTNLTRQLHQKDYAVFHDLASMCQRPNVKQQLGPSGVFGLFQQISPSADTALADLVIATPGHLVLCVAVREANGDLVIYRYRLRST